MYFFGICCNLSGTRSSKDTSPVQINQAVTRSQGAKTTTPLTVSKLDIVNLSPYEFTNKQEECSFFHQFQK